MAVVTRRRNYETNGPNGPGVTTGKLINGSSLIGKVINGVSTVTNKTTNRLTKSTITVDTTKGVKNQVEVKTELKTEDEDEAVNEATEVSTNEAESETKPHSQLQKNEDSELSDIESDEEMDVDVNEDKVETNTDSKQIAQLNLSNANSSNVGDEAATTTTPTPTNIKINSDKENTQSVKTTLASQNFPVKSEPVKNQNLDAGADTPKQLQTSRRKSSHPKDPNDDKLMSMCIEVLKNSYPKSLTIREINELIVNSDSMEDYEEICKSSTILSTKLNSFYRRCHPEGGELEISLLMTTCPIIRHQCPDFPRRLVYKWATKDDLIKERSRFEEESAKLYEKHQQKQIMKQQEKGQQTKNSDQTPARQTGSLTPPIDNVNTPLNSSIQALTPITATHSEREGSDSIDSDDSDFDDNHHKSSSLVHRLPTPPPMSASSPPPSPPYQLRKVIKRTPHAFTPPVKRGSTSTAASTTKKSKKDNAITSAGSPISSNPIRGPVSPVISKGMNPYYDIEPHFGMKCALEGDMYSKAWLYSSHDGSSVTKSSIEIFDDIKSPEDLSPDDLDTMVV